jgi:hypothetical protein
MTVIPSPATIDERWKLLYKIGGFSAIGMLAIMVAQIAIFIIWPPPTTTEGFFVLFQQNRFLGLLSMDLLYLVNNTILILIYLALWIPLKRVSESLSLVALIFGIVGITAYFSSNPAFEMLSLSNQFAASSNELQQTAFLGAGHALLATYKGTVFDVYYVLNAISLLIFAGLMLRSESFSKGIAVVGLISGILMSIPSSAGTIGLIFSLASLIPWAVFLILIIKRFFILEGK